MKVSLLSKKPMEATKFMISSNEKEKTPKKILKLKEKTSKCSFLPGELQVTAIFIKTQLVFGPFYSVPFKVIYDAYKEYLTKNNFEDLVIPQKRFGSLLITTLNYKGQTKKIELLAKKNTNKELRYFGVTLKKLFVSEEILTQIVNVGNDPL